MNKIETDSWYTCRKEEGIQDSQTFEDFCTACSLHLLSFGGGVFQGTLYQQRQRQRGGHLSFSTRELFDVWWWLAICSLRK